MIKVTIPKSFHEAFECFLYSKLTDGCRPATITHYKNSIHVFELFYGENTTLDGLVNSTVPNFFCYLKNRRLSDTTIHTYIRDLKTVLTYFMKQDWVDEFDIAVPKMDQTLKQIYTDEELKLLISKPNFKKSSFVEVRDWAVINFILGTGQRLSTVINLRNEDLDLENGLVRIRHLKNRKQILLPLTNSLTIVMKEYERIRGGERAEFLFCTVFGGRMTSSALISSIRRYNRNRGVEKTSIHLLRHTFAVKWVRKSGDIAKLQRMLTHSDIRTTQYYLDLVYDDLKDGLEDINPLEDLQFRKKFTSYNESIVL